LRPALVVGEGHEVPGGFHHHGQAGAFPLQGALLFQAGDPAFEAGMGDAPGSEAAPDAHCHQGEQGEPGGLPEKRFHDEIKYHPVGVPGMVIVAGNDSQLVTAGRQRVPG